MLQTIFLAEIVLLGLSLLGHVALCVAYVNHLNATGIRDSIVSIISKFTFVCLVGWPMCLVLWTAFGGLRLVLEGGWRAMPTWMAFYFFFCVFIAVVPLPWYLVRHRPHRSPGLLRSRKRNVVDVSTRLGHSPATSTLGRLLSTVPGNQLTQLEISEKEIELPRLPKKADGLAIAHLSDLHFTGHVEKAYFEEVVRLANEMEPDFTAVTGDILDDLRLKDWLPDTLGRLHARHGVYFVLGNHDYAVGSRAARAAMVAAGLSDLSTGPRSFNVGDVRVLLSGSEYPWGPLPVLGDLAGAHDSLCDNVVRVLLAHTPDEFTYARQHRFDLMLAGHSHGGQIRLPWLGPVVCPLRGGIKYAADVFHEESTVMHVSRGISSQIPIRLNCRPELVRLVLRCPQRIEPEPGEALEEDDLLRQALEMRQEVEQFRRESETPKEATPSDATADGEPHVVR